MHPKLVVSVPYPEIDEFDVFLASDGALQQLASAGQARPNSATFGLLSNEFSVKFPVEPGGTVSLLLRVRSVKQLQVPVLLMSESAFAEGHATRNLRVGLYIGVILVLVLYNLFIQLATRQRTYQKYVIYLLLVGLAQLTLLGATQAYVWPGSVWLSKYASLLLTLATAWAGSEFARDFLDTRTTAPRMDRWIKAFYAASVVISLLYVTAMPQLGYRLAQGVSGLFAFYILLMAFLVWRNGSRQAGFFLMAWTFFLVGVMVYVLRDAGVLPYDQLTTYAMPIGSAMEGVLLSFALADRINIMRKEKELSQAEALSAAQENARITRDQNILLEMKVSERTEQLQHSLDQLKRAQSKLVEAERMSSLGQLTAGIAHEINNPVNFIRSNIAPLKRDMDDIFQVLVSYRSHDVPPHVAELERSLGLDETIDEVRHILDSIEEGADRTSEIVRGLRSFSRLDEDTLKYASVDQGIRGTLNLLGPKLKKGINVELDLHASQTVECFPGKLNQVFMNVLANAIQAIAARHDTADGRITVRTEQGECHTAITITDNGTGMAPEVCSRIFEPFFTTKAVGEGTGLGLAIVHSIIEMHHGRIEVESAPDQGSTFRIIIPNTQPMATAKRA